VGFDDRDDVRRYVNVADAGVTHGCGDVILTADAHRGAPHTDHFAAQIYVAAA
jgi:hypothetical protein